MSKKVEGIQQAHVDALFQLRNDTITINHDDNIDNPAFSIGDWDESWQ